MEEELSARERSRDPVRENRQPQDKHRLLPTATALLSGTPETSKGSTVCCYCQQTHSPANCIVVTSLDARRQILKTSGRCLNCLMRGHVVRRCRSPPRCQLCKRKHHLSICNQTAETNPSPPNTTENTNVSISTLNPEATPYTLNPTTSVFCSTSMKSVFLQTARARVYNPRVPDSHVELRVLLDGGSQ